MHWEKRHNKGSLSLLTQSVLLTAFYFIGGMLGHAGSFFSGKVALISPSAGIAVAAIVLFGYRFWPGVAAGAILVALISGKPIGHFTIASAIGNTISAITCAYLLNVAQIRTHLARLRDATGFILLAAAVGTAINAIFEVVGLCYAQVLNWNNMFNAVLNAWVPNALGMLLVAPLILAWSAPGQIKWNRNRILEAAACAAGVAISCAIAFNSWLFHGLENYPMAFLPFPFLVWAALRFEQRGGTIAVALVAACAVAELLHRRGPFYTGNDITSMMLLGCFVGVSACLTLLLAGGAMERDEAHRHVASSERQYRAVVEDQFDLICRFQPDGSLTFVNDAYCRFFDKPRSQLLGSNYFADLSDHDREIPLAVFRSLTPERDHVWFDNRTFLDDKILWQQVTVRGLFDDQNQITEFQAVMQDITARKESEERLKAILDTMMLGVIVVNPPGTISSINPAGERIFARKAEDLLGKSVTTLFSPSDAAVFEEHASHPGRRGDTRYCELGALAPDGKIVPIEVAVTETAVSRLNMKILLVRDVSDRKQLEVQSQKMETIGRLTGGIAHDFRNLTQAILGYTDLLIQRMPALDANRETVTQIQKSVEQANSLTRQLLGFSRKRLVERKVVSLNAVVTDMNKLLKRVIGEWVRLSISICDAPAFVHADAGQLQQIIMNLAINARDAMAGTGELRIKTNIVQLHQSAFDDTDTLRPFSPSPSPEQRARGEEPVHSKRTNLKPGSYVALQIEDTGCGMHAEVLARIFEPFFTTKDPGQGTGLGLSIVKDIVHLSGGDILVDSTPGRGTAFTIYFPRAAAPIVQELKPVVSPITTNRSACTETILLVEDEELVRTMLAEVLTAKGYNVLAVADGMEGLSLSRSHRGAIDLLITDLMLPELPGWQLADRITKSRGPIPVLFMSGYTRDEIAEKTKDRTGIDFLQKPFGNETLLQKVRQILDQTKTVTTNTRSLPDLIGL